MTIDPASLTSITKGVKLTDITIQADGSIKFKDPAVAKALTSIQASPGMIEPGKPLGIGDVNVLLCGIRINTKKGCRDDDELVIKK